MGETEGCEEGAIEGGSNSGVAAARDDHHEAQLAPCEACGGYYAMLSIRFVCNLS